MIDPLVIRSPEEVAEHIERLLKTPGWQMADYRVKHEPLRRRIARLLRR